MPPAWQRAARALFPVLVLLAALAVAGPLWPAITAMVALTIYLNSPAVKFAARGDGAAFVDVLTALSAIRIPPPLAAFSNSCQSPDEYLTQIPRWLWTGSSSCWGEERADLEGQLPTGLLPPGE